MKKVIMVMIVLVTISVTAQKKESRAHKKEGKLSLNEFSPEEIAQLKTKQLTLALDLTDVQQQKIQAIELEKLKDRKAKMEARKNKTLGEVYEKPKKEERLAMINERLDKQIVHKTEMKAVLSDIQFEKWKKLEARKHDKKRQNRRHGKKHKR